MNRNVRGRVAIAALGLLLAALVGAGGAVAATRMSYVGSVVDDGGTGDAVRAGSTQVVSRRIVVNGVISAKLLTIPGLGELRATCDAGESVAAIMWTNTTGAPVDGWNNYYSDGQTRPWVYSGSASNVFVAYWDPSNVFQIGTQLDLGQGNSPGPRKTATITMDVYRSGSGAPCGIQATATVWSTP